MIAVSGLTCGYLECPPILTANLPFPALNLWQDSIRVGRMMSSCRPEEASEEAEISNQRESTALVAGTGLGTGMGWYLTLTSGHILVKSIVVGRANVVGRQGRPPHVDGTVGRGGVLTLIVTDGGASFDGT